MHVRSINVLSTAYVLESVLIRLVTLYVRTSTSALEYIVPGGADALERLGTTREQNGDLSIHT